jgi:hypothetical protein
MIDRHLVERPSRAGFPSPVRRQLKEHECPGMSHRLVAAPTERVGGPLKQHSRSDGPTERQDGERLKWDTPSITTVASHSKLVCANARLVASIDRTRFFGSTAQPTESILGPGHAGEGRPLVAVQLYYRGVLTGRHLSLRGEICW